MARKPYKLICRYPGCGVVVSDPAGGYCPKHVKTPDVQRGSASSRGYGSRWQKARLIFLKEYPICALCQDELASVVDHIIPHKGDQELFWDVKNWQPLCKRCHDRKTVMEDGGWGRLRK